MMDLPVAVMGVDSSLRGLAFALGDSRGSVVEGWETSAPVTDVRSRVDRYEALTEAAAITASVHRPRVVLIEGYTYGMGDVRGIVDRAELGGILRRRLTPCCEIILEVGVSTIKLFSTGHGGGGALPKGLTDQQRRQQLAQRRKDSKGAVMRALSERYARTFRNDDAADAFALMQIGKCLVGLAQPLTDFEARVVAGLRAKAAA